MHVAEIRSRGGREVRKRGRRGGNGERGEEVGGRKTDEGEVGGGRDKDSRRIACKTKERRGEAGRKKRERPKGRMRLGVDKKEKRGVVAG